MRRADQEQWFKTAGIAFTYEESVSLAQIHAPSHNQTRFATDEERVLVMAEQMKEGVDFPPIVVERNGKRPTLLDGFHRRDARMLLDQTVNDAYVVEPLNELQRAWLTTVFNVRNGAPPTFEERVQAAMELVRLGLDQKKAAREAGISIRTLQTRTIENTVRQRLVGIDRPDIAKSLGHAPLQALSRIKNPKVFAASAIAMHEVGEKSSTHVNELIGALSQTDLTESDQLAAVDQWKAHHRTTIASILRRPTSIVTRISASLSAIVNLRLEKFDAKSLNRDDRARYRAHCHKAMEVLTRLDKMLR